MTILRSMYDKGRVDMVSAQEGDQLLTQIFPVKEKSMYNMYKYGAFYRIKTTRYCRNRNAIIEFE